MAAAVTLLIGGGVAGQAQTSADDALTQRLFALTLAMERSGYSLTFADIIEVDANDRWSLDMSGVVGNAYYVACDRGGPLSMRLQLWESSGFETVATQPMDEGLTAIERSLDQRSTGLRISLVSGDAPPSEVRAACVIGHREAVL